MKGKEEFSIIVFILVYFNPTVICQSDLFKLTFLNNSWKFSVYITLYNILFLHLFILLYLYFTLLHILMFPYSHILHCYRHIPFLFTHTSHHINLILIFINISIILHVKGWKPQCKSVYYYCQFWFVIIYIYPPLFVSIMYYNNFLIRRNMSQSTSEACWRLKHKISIISTLK